MKINTYMKAALMGLAVSTITVPTSVGAETLRIMRGTTSSALRVSMNRAVVVESDVPFAELSMANPGIADFSTLSDRTIYVLGKLPGRTTMTLLGSEGQLITNVEVHVTPDVAEFKERLRQILPGEGIEVRTANDGIVLSGKVSSITRLDRALDLAERYAPGRVSNLMVVGGTQQVMLKVRFAEMSRSVSKELSAGITFNRSGSNQVIGGGGNGGIIPGTPASTGHTLNGTAAGSALIGFSLGSAQLGVLLEALENKGIIRTLAEPNLVALSGQEAKFLAGGEYPVPISQDDDNITVEFKPFGVAMAFTPRVVDGDVINLTINAAVSSLDPANGVSIDGGFRISAFKKRETSTTVEMRDGESFAIAGLLQDDFRDANAQVPWLGDIPILGTLFRSTSYKREQTELVIIVTPHLVTPTRGEALALPTDRVRIPTEANLFLNGRVAGAPKSGAAGEVARQDFNGSYGYVME